MKTYLKLLLLCALFYSIGQPRAMADEITICSGNSTNAYVPHYGSSSNVGNESRMIYPSNLLTLEKGDIIKKIKFYASGFGSKAASHEIEIRFGKTDAISIGDNFLDRTDYDLVYSGPINRTDNSGDGYYCEYTLNGNYRYDGGNLVIDIYTTASSEKATITWLGVSVSDDASAYAMSSYYYDKLTKQQFLPKMTITYEKASNVPTASIDKTSLDFGEVEVGKSAEFPIVITNTSNSELTIVPTFSITGANDNQFAINRAELDEKYPNGLPKGESITLPVIYSPTVISNENHNATLTMSYVANESGVSGSAVTVDLSGVCVKQQYALLATPKEGTINFGKVVIGGNRSVTKTVRIKNEGTATWNVDPNDIIVPSGCFEATPLQEDTEVVPGGELSYSVVFTPNDAKTYEGTLKITPYEGRTVTWFFVGEGSDAQPTQFDDLTYQWPINADEDNQNTSYMSEVATDPDQMIALLREVYMNKAIPGNKTRGYTGQDAPDMTKGYVYYPAVGGMDAKKSGTTHDLNDIHYKDEFGWNIPTTQPITRNGDNFSFDLEEYSPEKEGVTLLLVEMNDNVTPSYGTKDPTSYESLRSTIATQFKSVRVIKDFTTVGSGLNEATLFKIDCDNMNRFFFLAKGHLRTSALAPYVKYNAGSGTSGSSLSTQSGVYLGPFYWMYEQLSAYDLINSTEANDVYQALVAAKTYSVEHDCQSIPYVDPGHEFNMYGKTSSSADCQDVRDLMFIVPKYRMLDWDQRDTGTSDLFKNYNKDHRPSMGLFAIHQEPITGEPAEGKENEYQLHLTWTSNLKDFFPDQNGKHIIYQVITNEDGTESYVKVGEVDQNTFNFDDVYMPQLEHGYQVTFAIQAHDADQFVTLQMSNKQSYIIPGTNKAEVLELTLNPDHTSRFDPAKEKNYYSNALRVRSYKAALTSADLEGTTFKFYRTTQVPQKNEAGEYIIGTDTYPLTVDTDPKVFATATVSGNNLELNFTDGVEVAQTPEKMFPKGKEGNDGVYAGYHTNPTTVPFSVDAYGYVTFSDFVIYDNFDESTAQNTHSSKHTYQVKLTRDAGYGEGLTELYSTVLSLSVPKTAMEMKGVMTFAQANYDGADNNHPRATLSDGVEFDMNVHYSPKSEILAYYAYRWAEDEVHSIIDKVEVVDGVKVEKDAEPQGQADNQMDYYTVTMGETQLPNVSVQQGQMAKAAFVDDFLDNPDNAGVYDYAPVVEMFNANKAKYDYYNTYGAPLKSTVKGSLQVKVDPQLNTEGHPLMSEYAWYDNGEWCSYYNIPLKFTALNIPEGYQLYKVRAWRQISDPSILREEISSRDVRKVDDYLFEDMNYGFDMGNSEKMCKENLLPSKDYSLGSRPVSADEFEVVETFGTIQNETHATFGAKRMAGVDYRPGTLEELKAHFVVRAYFTRAENPAVKAQGSSNVPRHAEGTLTPADYDYYVAEGECDVTINATKGIVTGISTPVQDRSCDVVGVTYVNPMGQTSSRPFGGVNIIVTRYSDGTTKTTKAVY